MQRQSIFIIALVLSASALHAAGRTDGYTSTDLILPGVGAVHGADGSIFTTSLLVTNPTAERADFQIQFLRTGQANVNPSTVSDTIEAGATKEYDNVATTLFGAAGVLGALRIVSSQPLLA